MRAIKAPRVGGKSPNLRLEELVEALGSQAGLQFLIVRPESRVEVQGEGDEGRVFQVHVVTEAAGLHPDADRDAGGFDELERLDEFMERFEELLLRQFRRGNETGLCV